MDAKQSQLMNVSILFQLILIICFVNSGIDRASRRAHHVMSVPYESRAPRAPPMLFYLRKKSSRLATIFSSISSGSLLAGPRGRRVIAPASDCTAKFYRRWTGWHLVSFPQTCRQCLPKSNFKTSKYKRKRSRA
jgi:hypothetical protein